MVRLGQGLKSQLARQDRQVVGGKDFNDLQKKKLLLG